jgi:hypothetical protein
VLDVATVTNPWDDSMSGVSPARIAPMQLQHRLSFDEASGVITLPENGDWLIEDVDSDDEDCGVDGATANDVPASSSPPKRRYGTYYHHPERRRQSGVFP